MTKTTKGKNIKVVDYRSVNFAWLVDFKDQIISKQISPEIELVVAQEDISANATSFQVNSGETLRVVETTETSYVVTKPYGDVRKGEVSRSVMKPKLRENWSTEDVAEYVIKQACLQDQCTYLEIIKPKSVVSKREYQGTFVSQARKCKFIDLVGALHYFYTLNKMDLSQQFVWMDIFSANQPKLTARNVEPAVRQENEKQLTKGLHIAIANFDSRVMFIDKWDDATPLTRAWCVWELFGVAKAKKQIQIALPESEYDRYLKFMLDDFWNITTKLAKLDVAKAECYSKEDLQMIQNAIKTQSSYAEVNEVVMGQLRLWVATTAEAALQREEAKEQPDPTNIGRLATYVGLTFVNQGRFQEAEPLLLKSLATYKKTYGEEHEATALALNNLGGLYRRQGRLDEAKPLYEVSLRVRRKTLGNEHPEVADSLNNLGELLLTQGQPLAAKPLLEEALFIRRKAYGLYHELVAQCLNQLAAIAGLMGDPGKAEELYMACLQVLEKSVGPEHPHYALTLSNLAQLLAAKKDFGAAKLLLDKALSLLKKVHGNEHPSVANILSNIAVLLVAQGKKQEAKVYGEEAYRIARKVFGENHSFTKANRIFVDM